MYISRDVIFDENVFSFEGLHPNVGAKLRSEILLLSGGISAHSPVFNDPSNYSTNPLVAVQSLDENSAGIGENSEQIQPQQAISCAPRRARLPEWIHLHN